jgi:sigma-B regulation protein RsbU (phosphoserine phosphatase)
MTPADYEHFREILNEREALLNDYLNSLGNQNARQAEKVRGLLGEIDHALDRIENHSFGTCEVCKEEVEYERLEVQPIREVCLGCITPEEQERLQEELEIASKIHRALLPQKVEAVDGYDFAVKAIAARSVGGDYFDFLRESAGGTKVIIADSMGKGIPGGLLMSNFQGALRILAPEYDSPARLAAKLNWWLCRNVPVSKFISMVCVCLRAGGEQPAMRFANAGHNAPLIVRADGSVEKLDSNGGVLGVHEDFEYAEGTVDLAPGDLLVLYTDGVVEAMNAREDMFEDARLEEFCVAHRDESPKAFVEKLVSEVTAFSGKSEPDDDLTVIALRKK